MAWATDQSSGFLTAFIGEVTEGYFGTNPKYNDGKTTLLCLSNHIEEVLQEDYEGDIPDPHTLELPIGSEWFTEDGKTAEHPKGKDKFHASSVYGKLIDAVIVSDPDYDGSATGNYGKNAERTDGEDLVVDFGDLAKVLTDRGDPTEAQVWHGLRFEYREILFDFGPDREEVKKGHKDARIQSRRVLPIKFLGEAGDRSAKKAPAKKAAAKKAAAPAKSAADKAREKAAAKKATETATTSVNGEPNFFVDLTDDVDTAVALMEALVAAEDYDNFVERIVEIDAVSADDDLLEALLDESDTGPWARKAELG